MKLTQVALLLWFVCFCGSNVFAQQLSNDELSEILGIKYWRIPTPKDETLEWSIEIVDYVPRKYTSLNTARLNVQKKALIALRDKGQDSYEFTLKQRGTGQGDLEIDVSSVKDKRENQCDNSYSIDWFDVPKPYDDGTKFVIADIKQMVGEAPRKQIILEPIHFRLEEIQKEKRPGR